jgi:hypothetical protein
MENERQVIPLGFYPLILGLSATSALIAYRDLARGWVYSFDWLPAIAGIAVFYYLGFSLELLFTALILSPIMVAVTWLTLRFVKLRDQPSAKVGTGDYLAIALFSLWPGMAVGVITLALLVGLMGFTRLNWWKYGRGQRGIPLAGLMGLCFFLYIGGLVVSAEWYAMIAGGMLALSPLAVPKKRLQLP